MSVPCACAPVRLCHKVPLLREHATGLSTSSQHAYSVWRDWSLYYNFDPQPNGNGSYLVYSNTVPLPYVKGAPRTRIMLGEVGTRAVIRMHALDFQVDGG